MEGHISPNVLAPAPEPAGFIFGVRGPTARSVDDLELAMQVLAGKEWDELPPPSGNLSARLPRGRLVRRPGA